jgi:hypothetical protein
MTGIDVRAIDRLGAGRDVATVPFPDSVITTSFELSTFDGAKVQGILHRLRGSRSVIAIMHPRQQLAHHPMVAHFLNLGASVWTQDTRSPNNDLNLVHEQAILDVAAGQVHLRHLGFDSVLTFGHSGGGTLFAYYIEQAGMEPELRIDSTPAGRPIALAGAQMPLPDAAVFLAPHPGQGLVLRNCIDPSVTSANDPIGVRPELDMYDPANGFAPPGTPSNYPHDFVHAYRDAQLRRIEHIDEVALERAAAAAQARARFADTSDPRDRRASLATRIITTYRTDADLRYVDLSIDPNERKYGSLFSRRPDLSNYGLVGFGRLTTPDAWLSTWSALSSNAVFERCAQGIHIPTIYIEFSGDQAAYPTDADRMFAAITATDKVRFSIRGQHFGQPLVPTEPTGYQAATHLLAPWLTEHTELLTMT